MKCIKCNAEIPDDSLFCNICGAVQEKKECWTCDCGAENNEDYNFCEKCGKPKIFEHEIIDESWICSCGEKNNSDYNFCKKCGRRKPQPSFVEKPEKAVHYVTFAEKAVLSESPDIVVIEAETEKNDDLPKEEPSDIAAKEEDIDTTPSGINEPLEEEIADIDSEKNYTEKTADSAKDKETIIEVLSPDPEDFPNGIDFLTMSWLCKCGHINQLDISRINDTSCITCKECNEPCEATELIREIKENDDRAIAVPDAPPEFCLPVRLQNAVELLIGLIELAVIVVLIVLGVGKCGQWYDLYRFKTGYLENYSKTISVQEAFEAYFDDCSWDVYTLKEGKDKYTVVEFTGQNYGAQKVTIKYRRNKKDKNSELTSYEYMIGSTELSSIEQVLLLDEIYGTDVVENAWNDAVDSAFNEYC